MDERTGSTLPGEYLGLNEAERLRLLALESARLRARVHTLERRPLARALNRARRVQWRAGRQLRARRGQPTEAFAGLVDETFYVGANPDVAADGIDPLVHFLQIGWREGRDPNPLFDTDWYASRNHVDESRNPLVHYLREGARDGLDPSPWFSTSWYRAHAEVPDSMNPLVHYLAHGRASRVSPSPGFDAGRYLDENADVAAAGVNPLSHWVCVGRLEGRSAHPVAAPHDAADPGDPIPPELLGFLQRYAPTLAAGLSIDLPASGPSTFMTVVIRTQGRRLPELSETLLCLVAQDSEDFEVLLVAHDADSDALKEIRALAAEFQGLTDVPIRVSECIGGTRSKPLVEGMRAAMGRYCVALDDDDHVTADWISSFAAAEERRPRSVLRTAAVARTTLVLQGSSGPVRIAWGAPAPWYCAPWSLRDHVRVNGTPIHAYATPTWIRSALGVEIDESLSVVEDWDYLIRSAMVCGVTDNGRVTALYNRGGQDSAVAVGREDWRRLEHGVRDATLGNPVLDRWTR